MGYYFYFLTQEKIMPPISLDDLDISQAAESGYEFELTLDDKPGASGIFVTVQGDHSETLKNAERKAINILRQKEALRAKKSGDTFRSIEEDEQFGIESAARRVIAWRGISDECTQQNVQRLLKSRPEVIEQILSASKTITNFTQSK